MDEINNSIETMKKLFTNDLYKELEVKENYEIVAYFNSSFGDNCNSDFLHQKITKNENGTIIVNIRSNRGKSHIEMATHCNENMSKAMGELSRVWALIQLCEKPGVFIVRFDDSIFGVGNERPYKEIEKEKLYNKPINRSMSSITQLLFGISDAKYVVDNKGLYQKSTTPLRKFKDVFEQERKKDILFRDTLNCKNKTIGFTCDGSRENYKIDFKKQEEIFVIKPIGKEEKIEFSFESDDIIEWIEKEIKSTRTKQNLKALYQQPREYFDQFIKYKLGLNAEKNKNVIEKIRQHLNDKTNRDWKYIEETSYMYSENDQGYLLQNQNGIFYIECFGYIFVTHKTLEGYRVFEEKEKAFEYLEGLHLKQNQKEFEEMILGIRKKINI